VWPGGFSGRLAKFMGRPLYTSLPPETVIGYYNDGLDCWMMDGNRGQIAIALSSPITVSSITIEHVPLFYRPFVDLAQSIRNFEVWGSIPHDGKNYIDIVKNVTLVGDPSPTSGKVLHKERYFLLGTFEYSAYAESTSQKFRIPDDVVILYIKSGSIIIRILDNWGSQVCTAVYRIRVFGIES